MTFTVALWYGRGQVDSMSGLGALAHRDAEEFAAHVLNLHGTHAPSHTAMKALWVAWSTMKLSTINQ